MGQATKHLMFNKNFFMSRAGFREQTTKKSSEDTPEDKIGQVGQHQDENDR